MIRDVKSTTDTVGFPVVSWTETRGAHGPEAFRQAKVVCSIKKEAEKGDLYFVARGTVRHGLYEEGRSWNKLRRFKSERADSLYLSGPEREMRGALVDKSKTAGVLWRDHGEVILADFEGDHPIHINCAVASRVEIDHLLVVLSKAFGNKDSYMTPALRKRYKMKTELWPLDEHSVETYNPEAKPPENTVVIEMLSWALIIGVIGVLAAVWWYWFA